MGELLARILPLALGAAMSPLILAILVVTLSGRSHPRARAISFTAGMATSLVVVSILAFTLLRHVVIPSLSDPSTTLAAVDLLFGAVLLVALAIRLLRRPSPAEHRPHRADTDAAPRLARFYLFGVARMGTNLTSLMLFVPAVKDVAASAAGLVGQIAALAVLILITMLPALVPLAAGVLFPGGRFLSVLGDWFSRHGRTMITAVLAALGGYLVVRGFLGL